MVSPEDQKSISGIIGASEAASRLSLQLSLIINDISSQDRLDDSPSIDRIPVSITQISLGLKHAALSMQADDSVHSPQALAGMSEIAYDATSIFDEFNDLLRMASTDFDAQERRSNERRQFQSCFTTQRVAYLVCQIDCLELTVSLMNQVLALGKLMASTSPYDSSEEVVIKTELIRQERAETQNIFIVRCSQIRLVDQVLEASRPEDEARQVTATVHSHNTKADSGTSNKLMTERSEPAHLRDIMQAPREMVTASARAIDDLLDHWTHWDMIREQRHALHEKNQFGTTGGNFTDSDALCGATSARRRRHTQARRPRSQSKANRTQASSDGLTTSVYYRDALSPARRPRDNSIFSGLFSTQTIRLDLDAYRRIAEFQHKHRTSPTVSLRYQPRDLVQNADARNILGLIARQFQSLDKIMAELFRSIIPVFPRDIVARLLNDARTANSTLVEAEVLETTFLGELGHFCEALLSDVAVPDDERKPVTFQIRRVNEYWLGYLQDALELPYWELMAELLAMVSVHTPPSHSGMLAIYHIAEGRKRSIESQLDHLQQLYSRGQVCDPAPQNIEHGIRARLVVLGQIESLLCPVEAVLHVRTVLVNKQIVRIDEIETPRFRASLERSITFSILFITLALALLPGMIAFGKAAVEGQIGSAGDSDYFVTIRDGIMAALGVALAAVPLARHSHLKSCLVTTTLLFSCLSIALVITSVAIYTKVHRGYSSLGGFFAQFFAIVSLTMLSLEGAGGTPRDDKGDTSQAVRPGKFAKKVKSQ